jgi:hypothetical protein
MHIITHRGIDSTKEHYYVESSREAFIDQLNRGYGLEFDIRLTSDKEFVVIHDQSLTRISEGKDQRKIESMPLQELLDMEFRGCHLMSLKELLAGIQEKQKKGALSALHLKHSTQNEETLTLLLENLKGVNTDLFIIFDVTVKTAQYLKTKNPRLHLAPSLAHSFDIERYGEATGGTLLSLEDVKKHRELFDWVWLDEWDRKDVQGGTKKFYTQELFQSLRDLGLSISLVTPELHTTSPGLLGGESHSDAKDTETLFHRFGEILALTPDAVCTDYPDILQKISTQ